MNPSLYFQATALGSTNSYARAVKDPHSMTTATRYRATTKN